MSIIKTSFRRQPKYPIGDFRHRIQLQKPVNQPQQLGSYSPYVKLETYYKTWALVNDVFNGQTNTGGTLDATFESLPTTTFIIRSPKTAAIETKHVVLYKNGRYKILSMNEEGHFDKYIRLFTILLGDDQEDSLSTMQ